MGNSIRKHIEEAKSKVDLVLSRYVSAKGCPCLIRQFVYWAGKKQGPGWQDNVQNQLVSSTLELYCFEEIDPPEKLYGLSGSYTCTNCGSNWNHFRMEWRMLAFQDRLIKIGADDPSHMYKDLICGDVAATVGHEPEGLKALTLDQWVEFMMGRDYRTEEYKPRFPVERSNKRSFLWRLFSRRRRGR